MQCRDPHFGRVRVLGVYTIPYFPETYLLEALIHQPADFVDFSEWLPYTPPAFDDEWYVGLAHFYFDAAGEELIGSYLARPPLGYPTRAGLLLQGEPPNHRLIIDSEVFWIQETTPIPERLLRLIWVEEGAPFQGPDQALGDDL